MINELPTIFEVVTGTAKKQVKEKSAVSNHSSNKSKSNSKVVVKRILLFIIFCLSSFILDLKKLNRCLGIGYGLE